MKTPKSRSLRRVRIRLPGGKTKLAYKRRKPRKARCSVCGDILKGVPNAGRTKTKNIAKTKKRPERPYGGVLCSRCMRSLIVQKARSG